MQAAKRTPVKKSPGIYRYTRYGKTAYGFVVDVGVGQRKQMTRQGFTSLEAAEKARTALLHRKHTGDVVEPSRELLRDFFGRWIEMRKPTIRYTTVLVYRGAYKLADPALGHMELRAIRADHIQSCISDLTSRGYAPRTVRKMVDVLRWVFTSAVRWGLLRQSPAIWLDVPRIEPEARVMLNGEQLAQLVRSSAGDFYGLLIRTLVETWMRAGEVCDLRWGAIDAERRVIRVERSLSAKEGGGFVSMPGKTPSARRQIVVSETLVDLLMAEKDRQRAVGLVTDMMPVFRLAGGSQMTPDTINKPIRRACRNAGVPEVSAHWLRHSGISVARLEVREGADFITISQRAGHKDPKTTMLIYSHTRPEEHQRLGEAFGELLDVG